MVDTVYQLFCWFFLYAFLGWCVEVAYQGITFGLLVNRGFLNGPVCPIYGFGMVAVLLTLTPLQDNLIILFLGGTLLSTTLELVGGWGLYKLFHARWWDYSDEKFNLGGYICLRFSIMWGLGTMLMVRLIHPPLNALLKLIPTPVGWVFIGIFSMIMLVDFVFTVICASRLAKELEALHRVKATLRRPSDALSHRIGSAAIAADQRADLARVQVQLVKNEWEDRTEDERQALTQAAAALVNKGRDLGRNAGAAAALAADSLSDLAKAARSKDVQAMRDTVKDSAAFAAAVTADNLDKAQDTFGELLRKTAAAIRRYGAVGEARLLKAFPNMKTDYDDILEDLRVILREPD